MFRALSIFTLLLACSASAFADDVRVGIAAVDIEPEIGIPLAGYGSMKRRLPGLIDWGNKHEHASMFRPSIGRHSAIRSKAMFIDGGDQRLVFISLDFVGVEKQMVADIAKRVAHLGVREEQLVVGATHTHSGPGTISRRFSLSLIAVDRFRRENYEHVLEKIVASVEAAHSQLEAAILLTGEFETEGLQRNKFRRKGEQHFDRRARLLLARSLANGQLLGGVLNYALHGNGMPVEDLRFSSDVLGQIELGMERVLAERNGDNHYPPVILHINGAEGDVGNRERSVEATEQDGRTFAAQALASGVLDDLRPVSPALEVSRQDIWLGIPSVALRACDGAPQPVGLDARLPMPFMQKRTYLSAIRVGDILMLTWPGEPSVQIGYDIQDMAAEYGHENAWILGLTSDYQAYFTNHGEYMEGAYDSCSSLYRWKGALRIEETYRKMLAEP